MKRNLVLLLIVSITIFTACNDSKKDKRLKTDVNNAEVVDVKIHRYEKVLFEMNTDQIKETLRKNKQEYSFFLGGNIEDTSNILRIYGFVTDPTIREVYDDVNKKYPKLDFLEKELGGALTRYLHFMPGKRVPKVFTYHSAMDYENRIIFLDSVLCIAPDLYLGKDYKFYPQMRIPKYITARLDSQYIVPDCMKSIAAYNLTLPPAGSSSLLDIMIYQGKKLYFANITLPETSEETLIGYSKEQLEWCKQNEANLWAFFLQNKLLFEKDFYRIKSFINEGPTTQGFQNSPGRLGEWIGWQIVKKFMEKNSDITVSQLFSMTNGQDLLNRSGYRPQK